jgi:hypothetical protein
MSCPLIFEAEEVGADTVCCGRFDEGDIIQGVGGIGKWLKSLLPARSAICLKSISR